MSGFDASASIEWITVGGALLEVRRWSGTGVPILLLHEGLGSAAMWRGFPERLACATRRPVIAWSRQGYGLSDPRAFAYEPDYMHREAERIPAVMKALGIDRAIWFGHSDGASIALIAASRFPGYVEGLILEAPHVFVEQATIASIAAIRQAYRTTDLRARLSRYHFDVDAAFAGWNDIWLDPRFRDWTIEPLLGAVRAPAMLIQGSADEYGSSEQLARIVRRMPHAIRVELPGAGHSLHHEQPEQVLAAVDRFLEAEGWHCVPNSDVDPAGAYVAGGHRQISPERS